MKFSQPSVSNGTRQSPWLYIFATPIALWMVLVLFLDLVHLGEQSDSDAPLTFVLIVGLVMTMLLVGVWLFSKFRYRSPSLLIQILFVWGVFLLPPGISGLDIFMDIGLIVAIVVQLLPARRANP